MKYFIFLFILLIVNISCHFRNESQSNSYLIQEFKHIVEVPNVHDDGFSYSYHNGSLNNTEVKILAELFNNREVRYFISSDNKIYFEETYNMSIGEAFVFSGEIMDTLMTRNLQPSQFIKEVVSSIPKNGIPSRWDNAMNTWFKDSSTQ